MSTAWRTVSNQARCGARNARAGKPDSATRFDFGQLRRTPNPRSAPFAGSTILCGKSGLQSAYPGSYRSDPQPGQPKFATESNSTYAILAETVAPHLGASLGLRPMTATRVGTEPAFAVSGARNSSHQEPKKLGRGVQREPTETEQKLLMARSASFAGRMGA